MLFDPLAQTIAAYDRVSSQYADRWFASDVVSDFVARFVSNFDEFSIVLDAGCGSGREIKELIEHRIDCIGVDLSFETIKLARLRLPHGYFRVMDIRQLEFPDNLFDGVLCIAVVHHLFDRDFKKTLFQLRRVTRPGGVIGMTIRLGEGYGTDSLGRFVALRGRDLVESQLVTAGFSIAESQISTGLEGQEWLQVILSNSARITPEAAGLCGFCKGDLFLKENRSADAPIAASVLWGDDKYFVALDIAPLVDGHILLATQDHVLSTLGSGQDLSRLSHHKAQIDHLLKRAFNRKAVFLEHGTRINPSTRNPCVEHAHIHALPLQNELRARLETRIGQLTRYRSLRHADEAAKTSEYISYENKQGHIFLRQNGVPDLPSQFFRLVIAETLDIEEYHWTSNRDEPETRLRYKRTLRALTDVLDIEASNREIIADVPQEIRYRLASPEQDTGRDTALSKTGRRAIQNIIGLRNDIPAEDMLLKDVGEREIVRNILVPYFDADYRGINYIGDDAAVFPWFDNHILATTDHCPKPLFFSLGIESYQAYGWLSVIISLSDIAAMGGQPRAILLNTEMPPDMKVLDYLSFIEGVAFAGTMYGARIIGGNIREATEFAASTTVLGDTGGNISFRRDGAQPGQALFVAGEMGMFWAAVFERHHNLLLPLDSHNELKAGLLFPEPKLGAAQLLATAGIVGACMDASDGPTQAIRSLALSSGCDLVVDADMMSPSQSVTLVAKYMDIDPIALMFTWGNFELVFTAFEDELYQSLGADLISYKIRKVGYAKPGTGRAILTRRGKRVDLPQLAVEQFLGLPRTAVISDYEALLRRTRFQL